MSDRPAHEGDDGFACSCCGHGPVGTVAEASRVRARYRIHGLDCAEEVRLLRAAVGPLVGGEDRLAFDLVGGRMMLLESADPVAEEKLLAAVRRVGLRAERLGGERSDGDARERLQAATTAASGVFWLFGIGLHFANASAPGVGFDLFAGHGPEGLPPSERLAFAAAILLAMVHLLPRALAALRAWRPDMHLLVVIAAAGAMIIDEWFEAAAVAFLFALSLLLERWSALRARRAIAALLDLAPPRARVRENGGERELPVHEVTVGSRIVVLAGERVPLDGRVRAGGGMVDVSPITGESTPLFRETGEPVYAGTILTDGTLEIEVERPASDTLLARIIRMVEEAQRRRARIEQWVDTFARFYTPAVIGLAFLILAVPPLVFNEPFTAWLYRALVLLVLACPCALVVSTPVSLVSGIATAARHGVLVKGGSFLERAAALRTVAFDKTGTLTRGRPELVAVLPAAGVAADELLAPAAALEMRSTHPLARAVVAAAQGKGLAPAPADRVEGLPGRGIAGDIGGRRHWLGSPRWAVERGVRLESLRTKLEELEAEGHTVVILGRDDTVLGLLAFADRPRPEAKAALTALRRLGVKRLVMLTGDQRATARAIAAELGIDEVRAELLPEGKVAAVEQLITESGPVAMVGDGINDAPAMARADLAVAMGAIGTDVAIETADVALMADRLERLPWLVAHGRRVLATIRANITLAIAIKLAFVVLTAVGWATLWGAVLADVGATLLVTANALRLLASPRRSARQARVPVAAPAQ